MQKQHFLKFVITFSPLPGYFKGRSSGIVSNCEMRSNAALKESTTSGWILVSMATRVPGLWHTQQEMLQISTAVSFTRNKSPMAILNVWESKHILCVRVYMCACVRAHTCGWRQICKTKTRQTKDTSIFLQINTHRYGKYNNIFLLQI